MQLDSPSAEDREILDDITPEEKWFQTYESMPYKELAVRMLELRDLSKSLENDKTLVDLELKVITLRVVPTRFATDGFSSLNVPGVGRLGLSKDAHCNQTDQSGLMDWLRLNGFADLIKDNVNPSSLKSLVKELAAEAAGEEVEFNPSDADAEPAETKFDEIQKFVNFTPFMRAAVTKK